MFVSITPNPAMDYIMIINKLEKGKHVSSINDYYSPGGKGIHTARLVSKFGFPTMSVNALGAGRIGRKLILLLNDEGIYTNTIFLKDHTRTDVVIVDLSDKTETTITSLGPTMEEEDYEEFMDIVDKSLNKAEVVFMGGSVPRGAPDTLYYDIIRMAKEKGVNHCIITARGKLLEKAAGANPYLIKPDTSTIKEYFGYSIYNLEGAVKIGEKLIELGAENAIVSYKDIHDVLITKEKKIVYRTKIEGPINLFGAPEALLAGISIGIMRGNSIEESVRYGMGLSLKVATLESISVFDFSPKEVEDFLLKVEIEELT